MPKVEPELLKFRQRASACQDHKGKKGEQEEIAVGESTDANPAGIARGSRWRLGNRIDPAKGSIVVSFLYHRQIGRCSDWRAASDG